MNKETKRERFERLMKGRVDKIKHQHKLIGNLANKCFYDYNAAMINQVEDELLKDLDYHLQKFNGEKIIKPFEFKD